MCPACTATAALLERWPDRESKKEAIELTLRFMQLHKEHWPGWEGETEIRQLFDKPDFGPGGK